MDFNLFKVIYLDIALCQAILGVDISIRFLHPLQGFENKGGIVEAFVGQELLCYSSPHSKAELHFWKRKEKGSTAEIDYLKKNEDILPIEVKSGHGNTLRSLRLFLDTHTKSNYGMRFSALDYSLMQWLDSRPLYAVASLAHEYQKRALDYLVSI